MQRIALIHGPSNHGKTIFSLGLGLSFLEAGHFFAYVDAEYTTPETWLQQLMAEQANNSAFVAMRPKSYEEVVKGVRRVVETVHNAVKAKELPLGTGVFVVVDSIRKLVPKALLEKLLKGDGGIDGAKGRAAMMKAALNGPLGVHGQTCRARWEKASV